MSVQIALLIRLLGVRAPALWYGPLGECKGDNRAWPALAWAMENRWSSRFAATACERSRTVNL